MALLRVTNRNKFTLRDRYDGIDYVFEPNRPVVIEEAAARHFFGYGDGDKVPYLIRQGWALTSDKMDEGMAKLNKFVFEMGKVEFVGDAEPEAVEEDGEVDKIAQLEAKVTPRKETPRAST